MPEYRESSPSETEGLYDDRDVLACLQRCEKIDFHQQIEVDGIRFTAYNAGHVLGACQFLIEIAGVRILYTGDFSREDDRHLMGAECNPDWRPDILVVEQVHETHSASGSDNLLKQSTELLEEEENV